MSKTRHILLAHAQRATRSILSEALKDEGYSVTQVGDGVDLVDELRANEDAFDVVVSAVELPECSGMDVLEELREQGDEVPFLLLNSSEEDCTLQADALDANVLDAPYEVDDLIAAVAALLQERQSGTGNAA